MGKIKFIVLGILCLIILIGLITILIPDSQDNFNNEPTDVKIIKLGELKVYSRNGAGTNLTIISTYPKAGATEVSLYDEIVVTFNMAVDDSYFNYGFEVTPYTYGTFSWSEDKTTVTFTPEHDLQLDTEYTVEINKTYVKSQTGNQTLKDDYKWSFSTIIWSGPYSLVLGPVVDIDDEPIEGVTITIFYSGVKYSGISDESGMVVIHFPRPIKDGTYDISMTKDGYEDEWDEVTIKDGQTDDEIPELEEKVESEVTPVCCATSIILLLIGIPSIMISYNKKRK